MPGILLSKKKVMNLKKKRKKKIRTFKKRHKSLVKKIYGI